MWNCGGFPHRVLPSRQQQTANGSKQFLLMMFWRNLPVASRMDGSLKSKFFPSFSCYFLAWTSKRAPFLLFKSKIIWLCGWRSCGILGVGVLLCIPLKNKQGGGRRKSTKSYLVKKLPCNGKNGGQKSPWEETPWMMIDPFMFKFNLLQNGRHSFSWWASRNLSIQLDGGVLEDMRFVEFCTKHC